MILERLQLNNFRCFAELDLLLHPELTVLVAENGQGKTAILDAIRIALWPFVGSFDLARTKYSDPHNAIAIDDVRLIRLDSGDMARQLPARIAMSGDYGDGPQTWGRYRDREAPLSKTKDDNDTSATKHWASKVQARIREVAQPAWTLPVFGYYGTGRLWDQKRQKEAPGTRDESGRADFHIRTFAYRNSLDPASSYKHFKEWFNWAFESWREQQIKQIERPTTNGSQGFAQALPGDQEAAQARVRVVQQAIDALLRPVTGWHTLEYSVSHERALVLNHEDYGTLKADSLSDGIRGALAMVGDLAYRCIRLNPHLATDAARETHGVVLIDEVDMHLHPRWQQRVLGQLRAAFPKVQFIVTTHSPQVLTTVGREHIRVLEPTDAGPRVTIPEFSPLAHDAGAALARIMGTHREPELALQADVRDYELLVRDGQEATPAADDLRRTLEQAGYQFLDSDLATWRFLASRRKRQPAGG